MGRAARIEQLQAELQKVRKDVLSGKVGTRAADVVVKSINAELYT
jgi:hypothetical protein